MHIQKIRAIARTMEIDSRSLDKAALIRTIQSKEGNTPCFRTGSCQWDRLDCCWRDDCKPPAGRTT